MLIWFEEFKLMIYINEYALNMTAAMWKCENVSTWTVWTDIPCLFESEAASVQTLTIFNRTWFNIKEFLLCWKEMYIFEYNVQWSVVHINSNYFQSIILWSLILFTVNTHSYTSGLALMLRLCLKINNKTIL